MSGVDGEPSPDWEAFLAARERFFSSVRPEALPHPPPPPRPDAPPEHRAEPAGPGAPPD